MTDGHIKFIGKQGRNGQNVGGQENWLGRSNRRIKFNGKKFDMGKRQNGQKVE